MPSQTKKETKSNSSAKKQKKQGKKKDESCTSVDLRDGNAEEFMQSEVMTVPKKKQAAAPPAPAKSQNRRPSASKLNKLIDKQQIKEEERSTRTLKVEADVVLRKRDKKQVSKKEAMQASATKAKR